MDEDFQFLKAIFSQPGDDVTRLVYADWLEERGDPRGEYVRLDVERHRPENEAKGVQAALAKRLGDIVPKLDARWVGWMWQARNLPPGARVDLVFVGDGRGLIEVRGGQEDTVLLVEGRPVALNWDDCCGSVGQYLVFTGHTRGADYARQLAELVRGELDGGRPLAELVEPLLALFAPGTYCLGYTPSPAVESAATLEYPDRPGADRELVGYYPADQRNFVCTQPSESLDEGRVTYYREQVRAGRRPVVLTASAEGAWCEFVIDGHHKLAAYNREGVRPAVLGIVRWHAPGISLDEGLGWLPRDHPGVNEYRRMKGHAGR
jgi:uncharacterized protein (TIGR02996 family)